MSKTENNSDNKKCETPKSETNDSVAHAESSAKQSNKPGTRCYIGPIPGFVWNPLLKLPRNMQCPCRSGKKLKVCCLSKLPQAVKAEVAEKYKEQIEKGQLVFVTDENEAMLRVAADMQEYFKELDRQKRETDERKN